MNLKIVLCCTIALIAANNYCEDLWWITIPATTAEERTAIAQCGISIEEIGLDAVSGTANQASIDRIALAGFQLNKSISLQEIYNEQIAKATPREPYRFTAYLDIVAKLERLALEHQEIVSLYSIGKTWEERDLLMVSLQSSSITTTGAKPGILFIANHHAREHLGAELAVQFIDYLCRNKHRPDIVQLLETIEIYILPVANPDGVCYDFARGYPASWRKNRQALEHSRSVGVDLNRNFNFNWSGLGHSAYPASETYSGPAPASELETQALESFLADHPHISILVTYHSYGKMVLYPWGHQYSPVENLTDRIVFIKLAQAIARMTGYSAKQSSALYIAPGDVADWAYDTKKIFSFTIELMPLSAAQGGFYPYQSPGIQEDLENNIQAALYLCQTCDNPYKILEQARQNPR